MAEDDFYSILGVSKSATQDEIKKAYRSLAAKHHPDRNPGDKSSEERLKQINEAYEVLGDPEKRANYDRWGTADFQGIDMDGFGDLFGSLFRGFGFDDFGFGRRGRAGPPPGQTLRVTIEASFDEAFFGTEKEIRYNRRTTCEECSGSGAAPGTSPSTCPTCRGRGQVVRSMGFMSVAQTCPTCSGQGQTIGSPCPKCKGTGLRKDAQELKIPVPAGVEDGQAVRIRGAGSAGPRGGPHGDLIVVYSVEPHHIFVRRGLHVYMEHEIPFSVAVLGGEIEVPTMRGNSMVKVSSGTESGAVLRMKGKGVHTDSRKGDQLVRVKIAVPKKTTKQQREYLKDFESVFT